MLVTEFLEFGDLWRALPLNNAAGQRIFAWHKRCAALRGGEGAGAGAGDVCAALLRCCAASTAGCVQAMQQCMLCAAGRQAAGRPAAQPALPARPCSGSPHAPPACPCWALLLAACRGRRVLYDVAKGLTYLHHRRIVHLDLKSGERQYVYMYICLFHRQHRVDTLHLC